MKGNTYQSKERQRKKNSVSKWIVILFLTVILVAGSEEDAKATEYITNQIELNKYYSVKTLQTDGTGWEKYFLKCQIPGDGRIKMLISDMRKTNSDENWFICNENVSDLTSVRYPKVSTEGYDSGWLTVEQGILVLGIRTDTVYGNPEARMMIQYQSKGTFNGESEPNDLYDLATEIELNTIYEGNMGEDPERYEYQDIDIYKFKMEKSGLIEIQTDGYYELYEEDAYGNVERIETSPLQDKTIRRRVPAGIYYLNVEPDFGKREYNICVKATYESSETFEIEKNNIKSQANVKEANKWYTGNLNYGGRYVENEDVDYYQINLPNSGYVALEFRVPRQLESDQVSISLYDSDLNVLDSASNTSNPYLKTETILRPAGTYYIRVTEGSSFNGFNEDYSFCFDYQPFVLVNRLKLPVSERMTVGSKKTIKATVSPQNATNKNLKWTSSNSKVVSVSNGTLIAKAPGTATIKATATDGSGKAATCKITVGAKTAYKLNKKAVTITIGNAVNLKVLNAKSRVQWKSDKPSIATVTSRGRVVGKRIGKATIKAKYKGKTYKCIVNVKSKFTPGAWYMGRNGGGVMKIHKVNGNKFTFSSKIYNVSCKNITATIKNNGKNATAKFRCNKKHIHSLYFTRLKDGIRVKETSNCFNKLLVPHGSGKRIVTSDFHTKKYWMKQL